MKFSLFTVTYAGLFYDGKALTVEQQIHKAKELGFDGLSIETKRPVASPLDLSKADRARIKATAANEGIELCAIESLSNFCSNLMEERFKFRHVHAITGTFVLIVLGVLVAALVFAGRSQRWFIGNVTLRIVLPEEGAAGIRLVLEPRGAGPGRAGAPPTGASTQR